MPQENTIKYLIINQLTKEQYNELVKTSQLSSSELYVITDDNHYTEEEIIKLLSTKQDKLIVGDGINVTDDSIISVDLDKIYTKEEVEFLLEDKADKFSAGYSLEYSDNTLTLRNINGTILSYVTIKTTLKTDNITINYNENEELQSIGEITKKNTPKYTWIGTQEEYDTDFQNGIIDEYTECLITDSEEDSITPIVQFEAPTKLSELANDMDFTTNSVVQEIKIELENKIPPLINDENLVHKSGSETINGLKIFTEELTIQNDKPSGRIVHKNTTGEIPSITDGYIEFGENTLKYGKESEQGILYNTENNIFHSGNLIAGENITIIKEDNGIYKINGQAGSPLETYINEQGNNIYLNKSQITNCITEIPQNIKLELNNGTLTLKAGSIAIAPFGTLNLTSNYPIGSVFQHENFKVVDTLFVNGKFFVWAEVQSDMECVVGTSDITAKCFVDFADNTFRGNASNNYSGSTAPSYNSWWYDTTNNTLGYWNATSQQFVRTNCSLPLAIATSKSNVFARIDQVFNGMGYIGSTVWLDKGVKGLIPNGRNKDGTLNNIERTSDVITVLDTVSTGNWLFWSGLSGTPYRNALVTNFYYQDEQPVAKSTYCAWYSPRENLFRVTNDFGATWVQNKYCLVFQYSTEDTVVKTFNSKQPFRAVDYNDLQNGTNFKTIVETYVNGTSWYRVWSDGWCEQGGVTTTRDVTVTFLKPFIDDYNIVANTIYVSFGSDYELGIIKVSNSQARLYIDYGGTYTANSSTNWQACGYIA